MQIMKTISCPIASCAQPNNSSEDLHFHIQRAHAYPVGLGLEDETTEDTLKKKLAKTMGEIHEATQQRLKFIKEQGYSVVSIWEAEFLGDTEMQEFAATCEVVEPLQPRAGLYGGRTNATTLTYYVKKNEKIRFCSLYFSVLK